MRCHEPLYYTIKRHNLCIAILDQKGSQIQWLGFKKEYYLKSRNVSKYARISTYMISYWNVILCYTNLSRHEKQEETCMGKKYVMVNFFFTNILDELDVYCKL